MTPNGYFYWTGVWFTDVIDLPEGKLNYNLINPVNLTFLCIVSIYSKGYLIMLTISIYLFQRYKYRINTDK